MRHGGVSLLAVRLEAAAEQGESHADEGGVGDRGRRGPREVGQARGRYDQDDSGHQDDAGPARQRPGPRECLLLTHAATLFSIFEADVRAVDLRATHRLVTGLVERELRREDLPPATFGNLRSQELILAKTADRSVLGCMNDMAFLCEVAISDAGGLEHIDLGELNHALHRNINSSRGYPAPG
jgi:hypothetical protein